MTHSNSRLEYAYAIQNKNTLLWKQGYTSNLQKLRRRHPPDSHVYAIVQHLNGGIYKGVLNQFINEVAAPLIQGLQCVDHEYFSETEWFTPEPELALQLNELKEAATKKTEQASLQYEEKLRRKEASEEEDYLQGGSRRFFVAHKHLLKGRIGCGCLLTLIMPAILAFSLILGVSQAWFVLGYYLVFLLIGVRAEIRYDNRNVQRIEQRLKEKGML
jgi:hypothetical protein